MSGVGFQALLPGEEGKKATDPESGSAPTPAPTPASTPAPAPKPAPAPASVSIRTPTPPPSPPTRTFASLRLGYLILCATMLCGVWVSFTRTYRAVTVPGQTIAVPNILTPSVDWLQRRTEVAHHHLPQELSYQQRGGAVQLTVTCGKLEVKVCSEVPHTVIVRDGEDTYHTLEAGCHNIVPLTEANGQATVSVYLEEAVDATFTGSCARIPADHYVVQDTRVEGAPFVHIQHYHAPPEIVAVVLLAFFLMMLGLFIFLATQ